MFNIYTNQMENYSKLKLPIMIIERLESIDKAFDFLSKSVPKLGIYTYVVKDDLFHHHIVKEFTKKNERLFKEWLNEKRK